MTRSTRRGFHPEDRQQFSGPALACLHQAASQLQFLLNAGYAIKPALQLVGNRHQLSRRQRMALQRTVASKSACQIRRAKKVSLHRTCQPVLSVDALNLIITLETAISGSLLLRGRDSAIRDLAGLRGTYRLIQATDVAIGWILTFLGQTKLKRVDFYLDAPVSNSGRLAQRIDALAAQQPLAVETKLVASPDAILCEGPLVASSDSCILDHCSRWVDLAGDILRTRCPQAWIVRL